MIHKLGNPLKHLWLVRRMAKASNVDLAQAASEGDLAQEDWAKIIHTCRHCQWTDGCEKHLANLDADAAVPAECLNQATLRRLQAAQA